MKKNQSSKTKKTAKKRKEVLGELQEQYPEEEGYKIESEVYLRDENGNIVKDPITGG